jgi:hypothetical protein
MNTFLSVVWGLINPEMFAAVADTLEDVMQASVPGVINNVRVAEIDQGSNPIRILSLRALPDSKMQDLKQSIHEENKKTKDPQEAAADEEGGDYYNLEIAFAYHAAPADKRASAASRARNMHMNLVFYLGIKGLVGVPLPIFVELQELVGTVRLRLQMTPEPPFAKALTFTLMGVPHVQAGCIPMMKHGVNILNLPLISNFVNYAIGAAASMYVAPKSMQLDLKSMLQGDDITKDVQAMGVMWIRIHKAVGLSKQDRRGSKYGGSDPYINLSFSKYGKPMYCTRVITDDLNPVWEETTALLVTPELIKADEQLSVELWDSDRNSADDMVGKVELSMQKMIQHPGKMYPQISKLAGTQQGSEMPGELHWEVGYFGKPKFRPALRTDGKDKNLPEQLQNDEKFQDEKGTLDTEDADAVAHTPPDPLWPSGVCSVIVHQIVNLELENIKGSDGNRKGKEFEPAKAYGESTEEESNSELESTPWQALANSKQNYPPLTVQSSSTMSSSTALGPKPSAASPFSTPEPSGLCVTGDRPLSQLPYVISGTASTILFWVSYLFASPRSLRRALKSLGGTRSMAVSASAVQGFRCCSVALRLASLHTCWAGMLVLSSSFQTALWPLVGTRTQSSSCGQVAAQARSHAHNVTLAKARMVSTSTSRPKTIATSDCLSNTDTGHPSSSSFTLQASAVLQLIRRSGCKMWLITRKFRSMCLSGRRRTAIVWFKTSSPRRTPKHSWTRALMT